MRPHCALRRPGAVPWPARPTRRPPPGSARRRPRCAASVRPRPAPPTTALANTTSDSMTSAVVCAGQPRGAVLQATLPARKPRPSSQRHAGPGQLRRGGAAARCPAARPASPRRRAISAPPPNMASDARPAGACCSWRSRMLVEREAEAARQRQPVRQRSRGTGQAARRRSCSTIATPARASTRRSSAPARRPLAQQRPGQQHGPRRHQVEQQHHAHHVADGHRPVEADVGHARRGHQQPQQRLAARSRARRRAAGQQAGQRHAGRSARWPTADAGHASCSSRNGHQETPQTKALSTSASDRPQRRRRASLSHAGCRAGRSPAGGRLLPCA